MFLSEPITLLNIVVSISSAIALFDPFIADHHTNVAYIASQVARELGCSQQTQYELVLSGLLHDIGMLSLPAEQRRQEIASCEGLYQHSEIGYQLLKKFRHFESVANIIRYHHDEGDLSHVDVAVEAALLRIADRIDTLIDRNQPILEQVDHIVADVVRRTGTDFAPAHVDAFTELASKERFWLDIASPSLQALLLGNGSHYSIELDGDDLLDFAEMFAYVIDFRCRFTSTHSSGVATVASVIANLVGFSAAECEKMRVAGYLHDIGKLAVPQDLLEKPGKLSSSEYRVMKSHAYYTDRILKPLRGLDDIRMWAAMHHERMNGYGYPDRCNARDIPLGARVMAIADVFTALLEPRPYRERMKKDVVVRMFQGLARDNVLDSQLVNVLIANFDTINRHRELAQDEAATEYARFLQSVELSSRKSA